MKPADSHIETQQPIRVEQSVYKAAEAIEAEAARMGVADVLLADYQRVVAHEAGCPEEARAWAAVHTYLMGLTCLAAGTLVIVVPDSRAWDLKGPVLRPPNDTVLR